MNIKQFKMMEEIFNIAKQMVYEQNDQPEIDCQYMRSKIVYMNNIIKEYEKEEKQR
jgi:hypothetical protein